MSATYGYTKAALIRDDGYQVGVPAPCRIKCVRCGELIGPVVDGLPCVCDCGITYDSAGWVIGEMTWKGKR